MGVLASLLSQITYTSDGSTTSDGASAGVAAGVLIVYLIFIFAFVILTYAGMWKVFSKAGQPGWTAIIPILNIIVLLKVVKRPIWWIVLFLIPCVNFVVGIIVLWDLTKAFGKEVGMFILLLLLTPIGYLVLGFGSAEYQLEPDPIF